MKLKVEKLPILSQLLLFILPLIALIICLSFYFQYHSVLINLEKQEKQRKENIKEGMKLFIDNHDLSLNLIEVGLEKRIKKLAKTILKEHQKNLVISDLDSLKGLLGMDKELEDLYIINSKGIVVNTSKKADLGLDFYGFGESYKTFLKDVWSKKSLVIERVATENDTKSPRKYAYQAINEGYILEIGIKFISVDSLVEDFSSKINTVTDNYSNIQNIDLFAATEVLPPRNSGAIIAENVKSYALSCFKNKRDTFVVNTMSDEVVKTDLIYLDMRNSKYFKGYILQIVSDNSLKRSLLFLELKKFLLILISTLFLVTIVLYYVAKKITAPIRYLVKSVNSISLNNDNLWVKSEGNLEIEYISAEFNSLLSKINEHKLTLENKIKDRTALLDLKNKELEKVSEERGLLIKEIHHRVKNNLQIISSLLNLQSGRIKNKEAIEAFENSKNRVRAMALLHEKLYKDSNFITVDAGKYLEDLIDVLKESIDENITITVKSNNVEFNSSESISIGLITNEVITNALKHAFNDEDTGVIEIELNHTEKDVIITIFNNGKPLPENYKESNSDSLGMIIIDAFSEKLDGSYSFENVEKGVLLTITFPKTFSSDFSS